MLASYTQEAAHPMMTLGMASCPVCHRVIKLGVSTWDSKLWCPGGSGAARVLSGRLDKNYFLWVGFVMLCPLSYLCYVKLNPG